MEKEKDLQKIIIIEIIFNNLLSIIIFYYCTSLLPLKVPGHICIVLLLQILWKNMEIMMYNNW